MSPERAARTLAMLGVVLLLALFALRGVSLAQTLSTPDAQAEAEALGQVSLGGYYYSPDGSQVAFEQGSPGQVRRWFTMDLASGAVTGGRLELPEQNTFVIRNERMYLRIDEVETEVNTSPIVVRVTDMVLAPDGDSVAFTGQRQSGPESLYVLTNSGQFDWLGEEEWIHYLTWSPDGQFLVYVAPRGEYDQINVISRNGADFTQLTDDPTHKRNLSWSPDGSTIAYVAVEVAPTPEPVVRFPPTPTPTITAQLIETPSPTPTAETETPTASPLPDQKPGEGTFLGADIYLIDPDGANIRRLTDSPEHESRLAWVNGGSELAFALNDPESPQISYLNAINPQTGTARRAYPYVSIDALRCPPALPRSAERILQLTAINNGIQAVGVPVVLRAGQQTFPPESIFDADQRRSGAVRVETIDLQPGETRTVEWPVRPVSGLVTHFSAVIDRPEAVLFAEQHCAVQNTYQGLPNLPFLPVAAPLLLAGMLLMLPRLLQQKKPLLWVLWALIPVALLGLVLFEAQRAAIDKIFMPF